MDDLSLVVLFADADAERFVTKLIDRGIERGCLRAIRWRAVRDPMHDARVAREPTAALAPFLLHPTCRFIVMLDQHGSGEDGRPPQEVEQLVVESLVRAGVTADRAVAIVFAPELEAVFLPVWNRVLELLAQKRGVLAAAIEPDALDPKAAWGRALRTYRLKTGSALFGELAQSLSLEQLKGGAALGRVSEHLVQWFGALEPVSSSLK